MVRAALILCLFLCAGAWARAGEPASQAAPAGTPEALEAQARALYAAGHTAYDAGRFDDADRDFRAAFALSKRPELLFNLAATAERLNRPAQAAERLRAYLRVRPEDPDRASIEERIRVLD